MQEKLEILYIQLLIYYWLIKLFKLLVSAASEDGILFIGIGLKNLDQSIPKKTTTENCNKSNIRKIYSGVPAAYYRPVEIKPHH